jgi:hypothetical protein
MRKHHSPHLADHKNGDEGGEVWCCRHPRTAYEGISTLSENSAAQNGPMRARHGPPVDATWELVYKFSTFRVEDEFWTRTSTSPNFEVRNDLLHCGTSAYLEQISTRDFRVFRNWSRNSTTNLRTDR